mmetsp:Transcript_57264/g.125394  ORF Transcript_57264/g.125394 Transcript_57264/m.125394 type:complete len:555 (-) Transcript_57264:1138-2802(-)
MNTATSMFNKATAAAASAKRRLLAEATGTSSNPIPVNRQALQQLVAMGFDAKQAERALAEVGGEDIELASSLLLETVGSSSSSRSPGFSPGSLVKISGVTANDGLTDLNGCCGRIIKFDSGRERYLVDLGKDHRVLIKGEHLSEAPPGSEVTGSSPKRSSTLSSLDVAKNSMWEAKRKAETLLKKAMTTTTGPSTSPPGGHHPSAPPVGHAPLPPGATHEQRRAVAQAAEARLAAAQQRNAGTMDEWRRQGRQQWLAQQQAERRGAAGGSPTPISSSAPSAAAAAAAAAPRPGLPPTASAYLRQGGSQQIEDEDDELQRAINASLETAKLEGHVEQDEHQFQSHRDEGHDGHGDVDPEVVELHLQQAIAEEELSLQSALAESLSAHRCALEYEVSDMREAGGQPSQEIAQALKEAKFREHQVLEACAVIEERLQNIRELVAALAFQDSAEASGNAATDEAPPTASKTDVAQIVHQSEDNETKPGGGIGSDSVVAGVVAVAEEDAKRVVGGVAVVIVAVFLPSASRRTDGIAAGIAHLRSGGCTGPPTTAAAYCG